MRVAATLLAVALLASGCGGTSEPTPAAPEPAVSAPSTDPDDEASPRPDAPSPGTPASPSGRGDPGPAAGRGTLISTSDSAYGPMLFDGSGQAIYLFDKETSRRPRCYGACAGAWPPVLTSGQPRAGEAARSGLLGTVRRRDGSTQVTYGGHPLYYYAHEGRGQVLCHDVVEYGGLWLVVTPQGSAAPA